VSKEPYNILVFDGGGSRGLYSIRIVNRLLEEYPELLGRTKLISGASTGAIIGTALASGISASDVFNFYKQNLKKIFEDSYWDDAKDLGKLIGADYDYTNLKKVIKKQFGSKIIKDLDKDVLIPTFDLDNESAENRTWKPKFFNSLQSDSDLEELVVDVLIRTAAAPTYFPTYQGYIDGGLVANSTGVAAVCQAIDHGEDITNINLLSIGTGFNPTFISGKKLDWGVSQWAPFLIQLLIDASMATVDFQCKKLLDTRYCRINTALPEKIALDDVSKLDLLVEYADQVDLTSAINYLQKNWHKLA